MVQYSALRCVSGIWQNNEKLLISNGLRSVVTYLLTVALWVLFHCTTHSFSTSHPANRNTFLASYNTNRNNSESTMMTGTRYIISNSSNIYSNLSKAISQTRPFFHLNILKINEIWKFYSNYFPVKSLIVRWISITLAYQDCFISIAWKIRVTSVVFPKIQGCQVHIFLIIQVWWMDAKECNGLLNHP